jgi:hypothetical protein
MEGFLLTFFLIFKIVPREVLVGLPAFLLFFLIRFTGCCFARAKIFLRPLSLMPSCSMILLREFFPSATQFAALLSAQKKVSHAMACWQKTRNCARDTRIEI